MPQIRIHIKNKNKLVRMQLTFSYTRLKLAHLLIKSYISRNIYIF